MDWNSLADKSLAGEELAREEAREVLNCPDDDLLALVHAAYRVRRAAFGKKVKLNFLLNAKSGLCPEDCLYCSQSKVSEAGIDKYPFMSESEIVAAAGRALEVKASRFCMVNSGRGPTDNEVAQIASAVKRVRASHPKLEICVCLGILKPEQAAILKESGVCAYNHNLNTSKNYYSSICSTHTYEDRVETIQVAQDAGLSSCAGSLFGMGEREEDILEMAYQLRRMKAESVPLNFLIPIPGTPLESFNHLTPQKCLKIAALYRLLNPKAEVRIAGGREVNLRWLQPLGLFIANSIFIGDYLTTKGQKPSADIGMIRDLGFEIVGDGDGSAAVPAAWQGQDNPADDFAVQLR